MGSHFCFCFSVNGCGLLFGLRIEMLPAQYEKPVYQSDAAIKNYWPLTSCKQNGYKSVSRMNTFSNSQIIISQSDDLLELCFKRHFVY